MSGITRRERKKTRTRCALVSYYIGVPLVLQPLDSARLDSTYRALLGLRSGRETA